MFKEISLNFFKGVEGKSSSHEKVFFEDNLIFSRLGAIENNAPISLSLKLPLDKSISLNLLNEILFKSLKTVTKSSPSISDKLILSRFGAKANKVLISLVLTRVSDKSISLNRLK